MIIKIMTEPGFEESSWCLAILDGLYRTLAKKKLSYEKVVSIPEKPENSTVFLILIASDEKWLKSAVLRCRDNKIHPIVLCNQPRTPMPGAYSSVSSDVRQSMYYITNHLKKLGKTHPALYGINPASLSDTAKKESFLEFTEGTAAITDIYFNNGSLKSCFESFNENRNNYDSVICANDYAAISLIRNLENINHPPQKLLPVSYGGTFISSRYSSRLLTISMCYDEYGKAAISICETLFKNPALLYINIAVKWKISRNNPLAITDIPDIPHLHENSEAMQPDALFYSDTEMCDMILIENMLATCDKTDLTVLDIVLKGGSYEEAAEACFISHNTVKYRVKKLMDICGTTSKKAFVDFVKKYYK